MQAPEGATTPSAPSPKDFLLSTIHGIMDLSLFRIRPAYLMRDKSGHILYVGKPATWPSACLLLMDRSTTTPKWRRWWPRSTTSITPAESEREALIMERSLSTSCSPTSTPCARRQIVSYVKLTWKEDYPRLLMTRKSSRDGSKYSSYPTSAF